MVYHKTMLKFLKPGTLYTCPMHPEIIQDKPGSCPKCGMALEPKEGSVSAENAEYQGMLRRFWTGLALTVPVILLAASEMIPGRPLEKFISMKIVNWMEFVLATPVVLCSGWWFFERGVLSIVRRSLNMFTLIALGVGTAYVYSAV